MKNKCLLRSRLFFICSIHSQTRAFALPRLLPQTVCSLTAHEKQMSASQPLVFHLRVLYNAYTQKAKAAE
jgi:hypothetical protein